MFAGPISASARSTGFLAYERQPERIVRSAQTSGCSHTSWQMLRAVQFRHARADLDGHRGVGYERRSKSLVAAFSFARPATLGVAAPSVRRQAPIGVHGGLSTECGA